MVDEKQEDKAEEKQEPKPEPKMSVLEETKAAIKELKKEREEISKIKDELQQLRADQLLSGTAGGRVEPEKPKELTPIEYSKKVLSGEVSAKELIYG